MAPPCGSRRKGEPPISTQAATATGMPIRPASSACFTMSTTHPLLGRYRASCRCDRLAVAAVDAAAAGEVPRRLPLDVAGGDGVALVVVLAAPGDGQLDLGPAVVEVDRQGHEGEPVPRGLHAQHVDLLAVQEQLAAPVGVVAAVSHGLGVGRDVAA